MTIIPDFDARVHDPHLFVLKTSQLVALTPKGKRMFMHLASEFLIDWDDTGSRYHIGLWFKNADELNKFIDTYNKLKLPDTLSICMNSNKQRINGKAKEEKQEEG